MGRVGHLAALNPPGKIELEKYRTSRTNMAQMRLMRRDVRMTSSNPHSLNSGTTRRRIVSAPFRPRRHP